MHVRDIMNGPPLPYKDDIRANSKEYAQALDAKDPLRRFREEFIIPSKKDLKRKKLATTEGAHHLCGSCGSCTRCDRLLQFVLTVK